MTGGDHGMGATRIYRLANTGKGVLRVSLEPWGGEYLLAPGEAADLLGEGPEVYPLTWEVGDGVLVVASHADSDAMLTLWRDGVEIPAR